MSFLSILHVALFTFIQAACSTLVAFLIGFPAAFFCGRRNFPGRKALMSLSVVPFCLPTLLIALGYVTFLGLNGGLNHLLMFIFGLKEPPLKLLYSFAGLIIAQGFYNFPLIMKTVGESWEKLPQTQSENARLLGAGEFRIFKTITIYQLMPSIASSMMLVFIYCFLSFILVLLFGGIGNSTLEVEIYKSAKATLNFKQTGILALTETLILCGMTFFYSYLELKTSRAKGISTNIKTQLLKLKSPLEVIVFTLLIFLIILFFAAPLCGIIYNAFTSPKTGNKLTFSTFSYVLKMRSFLPSVKNTFITGISTAILCTIIGFLYALFLRLRENSSYSLILKTIPMLPMSISSVVLGIIITAIVHRGNWFTLVFAQTLLTWPLSFRMLNPFMTKIDSNTLDAAKILSKNKLETVIRVIVPICKKGIISSFGFCFAVSAGDTTLPLVLAIPKFDTLSLFTYRLAGAYRFNEACACGLILGLICICVYSLSSKNYKQKNKEF